MKYISRNSIASGIVLLVILTCLQQLPDLLDKLLANPGLSREEPKHVYTLSIENLRPQEYYISLGRPRHFCDIKYNNDLIFKGKTSVVDKRPSLLVGAGFSHKGGAALLVADCRQFMTGFEQRLSFPPRLYSYQSGIFVHNLRSFIDLGAGPIACLFLILTAFLNYFFSKNSPDQRRSCVFIAFSFIALLYALSLAHYPRLLMSGMAASQLHIVLRTLFSLGMASLLNTKLFPGLLLTGLHISICIASLCIDQLGLSIETFYLAAFPIYPITTFATLWANRKSEVSTYDSFFIQALLLSWGSAQALDWLKQLSGVGFFAAPLYLAAIAFYLTYSVARQQSKLIKANTIAKTLEHYVESSLKPADLIKEIGKLLESESCFNLHSIYLKHTFLGNTLNEMEFVKLKGAKENSPEVIVLDQLETPVFTKAMSDQVMVEGIGLRDKNRYLILPLGAFGAICFTSTEYVSRHASGETRQLLNLLAPSLRLINEKLDRLISITGASLNKLRSTYGDGVFPMTIGALFIDIADYSKKAEMFGDTYTSYVSSVLLPGLIKNMKDLALPEVIRGDEILFIICDETPLREREISSETVKAVQRLSAYMSSEAQKSSAQEGFGKVDFRVGFTVGEGTLVIDDVQARTSGDHINKAKRLQDAAAKGEFLTDSETLKAIGDGVLVPLARTSIVVKKNLIEAVKVGVKRAA